MGDNASYADFIRGKHLRADWQGKDIAETDIHPRLFDFQRRAVQWACRKGRAALFAGTGLGKTLMQCEWLRHMAGEHRGLIVAPLAVATQTQREAANIGMALDYDRTGESHAQFVITNYEMLHRFNPAEFHAVVLDESSILKSFAGKTKNQLCAMFAHTPYRLAATATPAPNDYTELGNHSDFLGIMPQIEMLMRWFKHDSADTKVWRLKGHAASDFWQWVASWGLSFDSPADLGFDGSRFELPPLRIIDHVLEMNMTEDANGKLFRDGIQSATGMHKELRLSVNQRAAKTAELVNAEPDEPWLIWCNTNYEADAIKAALPGLVEVRGSDSIEDKESRLIAFADGPQMTLLGKSSMLGFGLNLQRCARMVFAGVNYSYEAAYQSIRRCWRFGQTRPVHCHIVLGAGETGILAALKSKESRHDEMKEQMLAAVQAEMGVGTLALESDRAALSESGDGWEMRLGDSCELVKSIPSESVGCMVFSPPFANLYIYSDSVADMGNCKDEEEFFTHFQYLISELYRVLIPGRMVCIHCIDLPTFKWKDGVQARKDFPGEIIRAFESAGFIYHSRVTIWKDPVIEMQRTKSFGLLYKQLRKDSCESRQGMADYVIVMRKWGDPETFIPVPHEREDFPVTQWQKWASPVWMDINQTRVLNYQSAREQQDEKHICPLQLDVIERCIGLWSNPGDLVFSPFAGIGSEGYQAILQGRRFLGVELKESYYQIACKNLARAEFESGQPTLFDAVEMDGEAE